MMVTGFSLNADTKNPGLDSVYFSIDLQRGIIFNADSLRKGVKIDKVVATITFNSVVSEAVIEMTGGETREGEINYQENPTDSIDFTGNVRLRVKAANNTISTTYDIKVNVHNVDPDILTWDTQATAKLPSRLSDPLEQKTVGLGEKAVTLVKESDGTYTLSDCADLETYSWNKRQVTFPFTPQVGTLTATDSELFILAADGTLYQGGADGSAWTSTGERWSAMTGGYVSTVIGLKESGGKTVFAQYPQTNLNVKEIPEDFPIGGTSNFVTLNNKWTYSPVGFMAGGSLADGTLSNDTWAFDGSEWVKLSEGGLPGVKGASVIPYYNFRPSADGKSMIEYSVWLLTGGILADGELNRTVYISYNNGVDWTRGTDSMQLPESIPLMTGCDNIVSARKMEANLSDAWTVNKARTRAGYELDGDIIKWDCPYIYLFGGYSAEGKLYDSVWQGVLNRLTFTPII